MSHPQFLKSRIEPRRDSPPDIHTPRRLGEGLTYKLLLSMAAVQFCTGGFFMAGGRPLATLEASPNLLRLTGLWLFATSLLQGKLALKALKNKYIPRKQCFRHRTFWRSLFVGVLLSYVAALTVGQNVNALVVFITGLTVCYALLILPLLLPIAVPSEILERWRRLAQQKLPRRTAAMVSLVVLVAFTAEISLRVYSFATDYFLATPQTHLANSTETLASPLNAEHGDSRFHVAIVGDEISLGGTQHDAALSQIEWLAPGVRVTNFSMPQAGPREYADEFAKQVTACQPNLVLTFISVGEDMLAESPGYEMFDWRSLRLSGLISPVLRMVATQPKPETMPVLPTTMDRNQFLNQRGQELVVCRTPLDAKTERRWKKSLKHLDRLITACQKSHTDLALVIVPTEFQVNQVLLQTLQARFGYAAEQIDLDLPQRRLQTFAADRRVACVDLLPHLRRCEESPYERHVRHWNLEGTAVAVHVVSDWIQSQYGEQIFSSGHVSRK